MSEATYLVGIDLGTSNCAMAYVEPGSGGDVPVLDFPVVQLRRLGELAALPLLPSCLYLPGEHELPVGATKLPWEGGTSALVGELARWQGARVPGRLVSSAKSWLCHPGVDRSAAILPWGAPPEVQKLSPVEASAVLLRHLTQAWNSAHPAAPLQDQEVVITVPASFDEVARALTVTAARQAGLEKFTLLEEPQAAFYDFISRHRSCLATALDEVRLVLVVDVGGGTSDFTLVQVGVSPEGPIMRRIAVGEHLMLGGDNMDAALARKAEERLVSAGRRLTAVQWSQLVQAARVAKEALLNEEEQGSNRPPGPPRRESRGEGGAAHFTISIASEGSRLVGGAISTQVTRSEAEAIVLDGFLPACHPMDVPQRSARVALQELGLPYAQDPAITRHLAHFLRAHAVAGFTGLGEQRPGDALPRPDALLLNGGVFNSAKMTQRLVEVLSSWWPEKPPLRLLHHESLDLAVARGAAYYGLARRGLGRRIGGGTAHAIYVGLEAGDQATRSLCLVPRGQEEGEIIELPNRVFQLAVGEPVRFPLFSTTADRLERPGDLAPVSDEFTELPPIHTLLQTAAKTKGRVPVHLQARLTEIGTLELWCVSESGRERWRLEFELRGAAKEKNVTVTESMPAGFAEARLWVERIFGKGHLGASAGKTRAQPPKDVKQLWTALEQTLGPRDQWRVPVLRELWSVLLAGAGRRRRSPEHERVFFQLLGFSLRPGFGYPLDEWRCAQSLRLFSEGVQFHKDKPIWKEFWILWRRIGGGLDEGEQRRIWEHLKPFLAARVPPSPPKGLARPKGVHPEGLDEMVRLAASLEHLGAEEKLQLGEWISARLQEPKSASGPWSWALGRIGARAPIYGSVHKVIPPEQAASWVRLLLDPSLLALDGSLFALTQLARVTADRTRDLDQTVRSEVLEALRASGAPPAWIRMVTELVALDTADKARALGDTLPVGLILDQAG